MQTSELHYQMKDTMMKKTLLTAMACVLALGLSASTASALAIGDARYLGWIDPSTPANATGEVAGINVLIDQPAPSGPTNISGTLYLRTASSCGTCPDATTTNGQQGLTDANVDGTTISVTGYTYLLAKYGTRGEVWYIAGLTGSQTIPLTGSNGNATSHYSLYNLTTTQVPDGGVTAGLLGLAMLGVGYLRRRIG